MKKIFSFIMLFVLFTVSTMLFVKANNDADTLVIYYYRYDGNYNTHNIWLWQNLPDGKGGQQYEFSNSKIHPNYGSYIEINLEDEGYGETTRFGIIVKQGLGWDGAREPGGDRFFNTADIEIVNGKYHVYIVEQDYNIGTSQADLDNDIPNYKDKILKADFEANESISVNLTAVPTKVEVIVGGTIIHTANPTNTSFNIVLSGKVNLLNSYTLKATFPNGDVNERIVSISKLYDTTTFKNSFTYDGELGAIYEEAKTTFRLWAPISENVTLNLYHQGHPSYDRHGNSNVELIPYKTYDLSRIESGAWEVVVNEDLANVYYTFSVTNYGITNEVTDPYSYSTGANGMRSMVVDFNSLNPTGWQYNSRPNNITNLTDYIVYELHVRDLTSHSSWNGPEAHRGKFLGFTDSGTTYTNNSGVTVTTGLDHLDELGINAVQLLPIFDFGYVDEAQLALNSNYTNTFNWGYMPYHFNTLEGSYSTNPFDGGSRVNEFKQLVQALHDRDMRVIMDVVYNHTGESETSNFHKILPGYYHRLNNSGGFYNGSGTGNETASQRPMMRKFMKDSLAFLATEYNLSGFRFDLMALHDVQTMSEIEDMLYAIDPTIILYGEPWDAGGSPDDYAKAGKDNIKNFDNIGAFNDTSRDAIKGSTFSNTAGGWLQNDNRNNHIQNIRYGIVGGTNHPQVNVNKWHLSPQKTINYISAHDNHTLNDKLEMTGYSGSRQDALKQRLQVQGNAIILTSQGVPFLHAGVEFMRSKPLESGGFEGNSYESPDSVNQLRWDRKARYNDVFEYYKALIHIRKNNPQFRLINSSDIINYLEFKNTNEHVIHFEINHPDYPTVVVVHNGHNSNMYNAILPAGKTFTVHSNLVAGNPVGITTATGVGVVTMNTSVIFIEDKGSSEISTKETTVHITKGNSFNPLSNINYNASTDKVYISGHYDVNVSGSYVVAVTVLDKNGKLVPLTYTLVVSGPGSNVTISGGN